MKKLQQLIASDKIKDAAALASQIYPGSPNGCRNYDQTGSMTLTMTHGSGVSAYERYLDLSDSTSGVYYQISGVTYFREYIASYPDDMVAIRIVASQAGAVSFTVGMARGGAQTSASGNTLTMTLNASGSNMGFTIGARVTAQGGTVTGSGSTVKVTNANEACIYIKGWTTFRQQNNHKNKVTSDLAAVSGSYTTIRSAHVDDYQKLFSRVVLNVGASNSNQRGQTTAQRAVAFLTTLDPDLITLYFQFSRYLLISSSRKGGLPANLQGLWNQVSGPIWGSRYTLNINLRE